MLVDWYAYRKLGFGLGDFFCSFGSRRRSDFPGCIAIFGFSQIAVQVCYFPVYPVFIRRLSAVYPPFIRRLFAVYPLFSRRLSAVHQRFFRGLFRCLSVAQPRFIRRLSVVSPRFISLFIRGLSVVYPPLNLNGG